MAIRHRIQGDSMQMVVCQLGCGQSLYVEAGKFL